MLRRVPVPQAQYNGGLVFTAVRWYKWFTYSLTHFSIKDHEIWLEHVWSNLLFLFSCRSSSNNVGYGREGSRENSLHSLGGNWNVCRTFDGSSGNQKTHADDTVSALFSCFAGTALSALPQVLISMLFLCLGGPCIEKGLRLPSLKSDVHSTCWFFKQLCPQKNQDKPLTLSFRRNWGQGRGVGGV